MGIGGRVVVAAHSITRLKLRFESSVVARIVPLFVQFRRNGIIDAYRAAKVLDVIFALFLTVVVPSFATVYTVDYGAHAAAAAMVTIPLAVLVLIFRRTTAPGPTAGVVKR